ncbi:MAG: inovirus-type Gp2 protein [Marinagarivorans sp.]|nr:inovirus-type Gp2 protein [Marinagarivorans sp.]
MTSPLIECEGVWWKINTEGSGIYSGMMRAILGQLFAMLSHHNKVLVFRFDLSTPNYTNTNKEITDFLRRLSGRIKSHYKCERIGHAWVREQEKAKSQHYHFALILDGNKIQTVNLLWTWVKTCWEFTEGRAWRPKKPYYRLDRHDPTKTAEAVYRLSYLAKGRGKGYKPDQTKNYSTSRIKRKEG